MMEWEVPDIDLDNIMQQEHVDDSIDIHGTGSVLTQQ